MSGNRESTTLTGEELELLQDVRNIWGQNGEGKKVSTPKLLGICMRAALEHRTKTMCAWTELMVGTTNAMIELGVEEDSIKVIQWCNLLMQQVLTGNVPAGLARQMTGMADDWIRQRKEEMMLEYEESLREAMG